MNHIYGLSPVLESLRARRRSINKLLIASGAAQARLGELIETARRNGVKVEKRDRKFLDELTGNANHQGVVAITDKDSRAGLYCEPDAIIESMSVLPLVVLLDGIEDPHNLGAILRTAECAGVDGVFVPQHRAAGLTETVAKTSAGAVEYIKVAKVINLVPLIDELKDHGLWIIGIEAGEEQSYTGFDFNVPVALVFGSEGKGLRRLVRQKCDALLSIPMSGRLNSLNVSVAAGILLFEVLRQRGNKLPDF